MVDIVMEGLKIINFQRMATGIIGNVEIELDLEWNPKHKCWEVNCFLYDNKKGVGVELWKFFPNYESAKQYFENIVKKHGLKIKGEENREGMESRFHS
ncbi:hypothetical protein DRO69_00525 [Candidatus Bathyarchaeota archaeon]|nr:MAG: hypothetical protein DRO69_00525 [Candidatus Bathyarchaeota archaeon]